MSDKLVLYHGSEMIVEKPQFGLGKKIMIMGLDFIVLKTKN